MKRITVTAFILMFAFWAACACGAAERGQEGRGDVFEEPIPAGANVLRQGVYYYELGDFSSYYNNEISPRKGAVLTDELIATYGLYTDDGGIPAGQCVFIALERVAALDSANGRKCYIYSVGVGTPEGGLNGSGYQLVYRTSVEYSVRKVASLFDDFSGEYVRTESTGGGRGDIIESDPGDSGGPAFTLFAEFAFETRTKVLPIPQAGSEKMPASNSAAAFFLADGLSEWTGFDFTLNDVTFGEDSVTVDWSADSTLIAGPDDRDPKEGFRFLDFVSLNWFMMDSLAQTLKNNLPIMTVYYCSDGKPIPFTAQEDMAAEGLPELPVDQPYEGSAFFKAHAGGRGDLIDDEEIPGWWGEYKSDETSCSIGITNFNTNPEGQWYFLFTIMRGGAEIDHGTAAVFSENMFTAEYAEILFTLSADSSTLDISVPETSEWSYLAGSYGRAR